MKAFSPQFIIASMIGLAVCAAASAAVVEARAHGRAGQISARKRARSLGRWIKNLISYSVAAVLIGFLSLYSSASFLMPYFPETIRDCDHSDLACIGRVDQDRHTVAFITTLTASELLALGCIAVLAWRRRKISPYEIQLDNALLERIGARFPKELAACEPIYSHWRGVPPELIWGFLKEAGAQGKTTPLFDENNAELWESMFRRYPRPPKTEAERLKREDEFWGRYATRFTKLSADGALALTPKPEMVLFFSTYEKWVVRDYFAATGTVIKLSTSRSGQQAKEQHIEKGAGWFALEIETAFKKTHGMMSDFGPQSAISPGDHPANDDLTYRHGV